MFCVQQCSIHAQISLINLVYDGPREGSTWWRSSTTREAPSHSSWQSLLCSMQLHNKGGLQTFSSSFCRCSHTSFSAVWFLASQLVISLHLSRISYLSSLLILPWSFSSSTVAFMLNIQDSSKFLKDTLPVFCRRKFYKILLQKYLLEICNA